MTTPFGTNYLAVHSAGAQRRLRTTIWAIVLICLACLGAMGPLFIASTLGIRDALLNQAVVIFCAIALVLLLVINWWIIRRLSPHRLGAIRHFNAALLMALMVPLDAWLIISVVFTIDAYPLIAAAIFPIIIPACWILVGLSLSWIFLGRFPNASLARQVWMWGGQGLLVGGLCMAHLFISFVTLGATAQGFYVAGSVLAFALILLSFASVAGWSLVNMAALGLQIGTASQQHG